MSELVTAQDTTQETVDGYNGEVDLAAALAALDGGSEAPADSDAGSHLSESAGSGEPATAEAAPEETPEVEPEEEVKLSPAKEAKALLDLQRAQKANLEAKRELDQLRTQHGELQALIERAKKDPHEALKLAGTTYDDFTKKLLEGGAEPVDPIRAELEALRAQLADKEQKAQEQAERAQNLEAIKESLPALAEDFPVSASIPGIEQRALEAYYASSGEKSLEEIFDEAEKAITSDAVALMSSEASLRSLLQNENIRTLAQQILGAAAPKSTSPSTPRSTPSANGSPGSNPLTSAISQDEDDSEEARMKAAVAALSL